MSIIWNGNFGGQSDSKFSGIAGSFAECVAVDGHSIPGVLTVYQKLAKNSGATVTEFCKVAIAVSNGYTFWFSSTSGKIWARSSGGSWTLAYTTAPAAGAAGCLGALEFNGYIYWATQSRLHRIAIGSADGAWAGEDLDWATFGVTDDLFHPMALQYSLTGRHLFIGDGNQVAEVNNAGTFDANVLDLNTPYRIKSMAPYDIDLLLGTYVADTVNETQIIRWDTISPSWNTSDPIKENGINAFISDDNYMYVNAGKAGNLYYYDGQYLIPFKKIPGAYSSTKYGEVHPGSVANLQGIPVFGFSNGLGNPAKQGVYSLGSYSRDYRKVMDLSYPISQGKVEGVQVGAVLVAGFDIFAAWECAITATMTIANPCVVTLAAHGLSDGTSVVFTTTGALPTGITAGTAYFAKSTGTNTFNLYDTAAHAVTGGATGRVTTTGTQSGVHTITFSMVDKIDYSNKYASAYVETMMLKQKSRGVAKTLRKVSAYYNSLPASTGATFYYSINGAAYVAMTSVTNSKLNEIYAKLTSGDIGSLQIKMAFTVSSNDAPVIEAIGVDF